MSFTGFINDIAKFLHTVDVNCFPSQILKRQEGQCLKLHCMEFQA